MRPTIFVIAMGLLLAAMPEQKAIAGCGFRPLRAIGAAVGRVGSRVAGRVRYRQQRQYRQQRRRQYRQQQRWQPLRRVFAGRARSCYAGACY